MCYRPLHIKNNSRHFDPTSMPLYFEVPCGKCEDCKRSRQSEWFVRTFYQLEDAQSKGGCGYFYTLTYNDEHLPTYNGVKCFSREDIELFIKRLSERLRSKYDIKLSYLISCEFGTLFQRPHYHCDFITSKSLMPWTFYKEVEESWQKGFVYAGSDGGVINSPSAILYVTKYITKDTSFSSNDSQIYAVLKDDYSRAYSEWVNFAPVGLNAPDTFDELIKLRSSYTNVEEVISWYNEFIYKYRRMSTFNAHSIELGYCALSRPDRINFEKDTILIPQGKQYKPVPLPRYLKRKFYYDTVRNETDGKKNKFVLNVRGKQHLLDTLETRINERALEYENFFKTTRLTDYQFKTIDTHFNFRGNQDMRMFLDNLDVDYKRLAIYNIVYRNRFSVGVSFDYWTEYKEYVRQLFSILEDPSNSPVCSFDSKAVNYINDNLFNFKPEMFIYEQLSLLYSQMVCIIRKEQALLDAQKKETERKLRDVIKMSNLNIKKVS